MLSHASVTAAVTRVVEHRALLTARKVIVATNPAENLCVQRLETA